MAHSIGLVLALMIAQSQDQMLSWLPVSEAVALDCPETVQQYEIVWMRIEARNESNVPRTIVWGSSSFPTERWEAEKWVEVTSGGGGPGWSQRVRGFHTREIRIEPADSWRGWVPHVNPRLMSIPGRYRVRWAVRMDGMSFGSATKELLVIAHEGNSGAVAAEREGYEAAIAASWDDPAGAFGSHQSMRALDRAMPGLVGRSESVGRLRVQAGLSAGLRSTVELEATLSAVRRSIWNTEHGAAARRAVFQEQRERLVASTTDPDARGYGGAHLVAAKALCEKELGDAQGLRASLTVLRSMWPTYLRDKPLTRDALGGGH